MTTDSLFQIGSMTKAYTATVVLALVDQGLAAPLGLAHTWTLPETCCGSGPRRAT